MGAAAVIPSLIPLIMVGAMRRAEARIHRKLVEARALTAESAIPLAFERPIERRRIRALVDGGAVCRTANDHYFLDADGWTRHLDRRRRRQRIAISVVLSLLGIGAVLSFVLR